MIHERAYILLRAGGSTRDPQRDTPGLRAIVVPTAVARETGNMTSRGGPDSQAKGSTDDDVDRQ